ncbi:TonB family protein [Pseudoduganella sp. OTU4001]|uniref:TonB family protein n=1 Tax=Pseudoduganella sp. OTU4001 TaxID=3043854 RepID=UPI00313CC6B3
MKTLPALLASLAFLPAQAQTEGVGRMDQSAQKQLSVDFKSCAKPVWPRESLRKEETGRVTLEFLIGLDGKVMESKVLTSSGYPLLDLAAQDGLAKCQFTAPASIGRTEPTRTRIQYAWTLEEAKSPAEQKAEWERSLAAAEQGDSEAQVRVASGYLSGDASKRNPAEGMRWLRAAAEQGNVRGMEALALELRSGRHVEADPLQALEWLEKAVAAGSPMAEFSLAMALTGPKSVRPDEARARALLEKAIAGGHKFARMPLAAMLLKEGGSSTAEAVRLLQEGAEEQDRMAQFLLGTLYEKGEHLPADRARAQALYERAAAGGIPYARTALARLKQQEAK